MERARVLEIFRSNVTLLEIQKEKFKFILSISRDQELSSFIFRDLKVCGFETETVRNFKYLRI